MTFLCIISLIPLSIQLNNSPAIFKKFTAFCTENEL